MNIEKMLHDLENDDNNEMLDAAKAKLAEFPIEGRKQVHEIFAKLEALTDAEIVMAARGLFAFAKKIIDQLPVSAISDEQESK